MYPKYLVLLICALLYTNITSAQNAFYNAKDLHKLLENGKLKLYGNNGAAILDELKDNLAVGSLLDMTSIQSN